jgi:hypothetical protein
MGTTDFKQGIAGLRAALCAGAVGVAVTKAPAGAQPLVPFPLVPSPDCDWDTWNTASDIDQHNGSVVHISWGINMRGAAAVNEWRGQIEGPVVVKGTNEIDFTIPFSFAGAGFGGDPAPNGRELTHYGGSINPDGSASGTWSNQNNGASGTWDMSKTFRCTPNKPAAAPDPATKPTRAQGKPRDPVPEDVLNVQNAIKLSFGPPKPFSITATIANSSSLKAQCTYDASPLDEHRDFTVEPKSSTDLKIDGVQTFTTYHVVVSCFDASGQQAEEMGHAETDVVF